MALKNFIGQKISILITNDIQLNGRLTNAANKRRYARRGAASRLQQFL
jgi:hypothetical protein